MTTINLSIHIDDREIADRMIRALGPITELTAEQTADDYVSLRDAAREAPVTYKTLYTWVKKEGRIPYAQKGGKGKIFVSRSDLKELLRFKTSVPKTSGRPKAAKPKTFI